MHALLLFKISVWLKIVVIKTRQIKSKLTQVSVISATLYYTNIISSIDRIPMTTKWTDDHMHSVVHIGNTWVMMSFMIVTEIDILISTKHTSWQNEYHHSLLHNYVQHNVEVFLKSKILYFYQYQYQFNLMHLVLKHKWRLLYFDLFVKKAKT